MTDNVPGPDIPGRRSGCTTLNDALNNLVDHHNLVYDPLTKRLCLKSVNLSNSVNNKHPVLPNDDLKKSPSPLPNNNQNQINTGSPNKYSSAKDELNQPKPQQPTQLLISDKLLNLNLNPIDDDNSKPNLVSVQSIRRPDNLPPKSKDEERKHRAQFLEILQHARRKDLKERKLKKDVRAKQVHQEKQIQKAIQIWTNEILPNWSQLHNSKRVHELWWHGIPSSIRPKVWSLVIGNDLNITEQLFHICVKRSKEKIWTKQFNQQTTCSSAIQRRNSNPSIDSFMIQKSQHRRASSINLDNNNKDDDDVDDDSEEDHENIAFLIKLDVLRTFPQLGLFQETGPYHESLCDILSAYVVYRPDIGYCQGMSFLAAMLLLNCQSTFSAFKCLANLLNNDLLLAFYSLNQKTMRAIYAYYDRQFQSLMPNLAQHFQRIGLSTDLFFMYQLYTIFARSLSLDCASRVWDLFLRDGNELIFRASLAILSMYQHELIHLEFIDSARFLTNLPEDMDIGKYFECIYSIKLSPPKLSSIISSCTEQDDNNINLDHQYSPQSPNSTPANKSHKFFTSKFFRF